MKKKLGFVAALVAAGTIAGCGGGGSAGTTPLAAVTNQKIADLAIPNFNGAGVAASFDLVYVDQATHVAMFTDRNNSSIDKIGYFGNGGLTPTLDAQYKLGLTGCALANGAPNPGCGAAVTANSGPNGLHGLPGTTTITTGDVQKIVVFNETTGAAIATIPHTNPIKGNTGFRTDEGCVLPAAKSPIAGVPIAAYSNTSEGTQTVGGQTRGLTYYTFVRLDTNAVIGQLVEPNSTGQELCLFDTTGAAAIMYFDDDGDIPAVNSLTGVGNPDGAIYGLHMPNLIAAFAAAQASPKNGNKYLIMDLNANVAADIVTGLYPAGAVGIGATLAAADYKTTPATGVMHLVAGFNTTAGIPAGLNCGPAGMALNSNNNADVAVSCRPPLGQLGAMLVFNRNTGAFVAAPNAALADQMQFDNVGNLYLLASSRWTSTGLSPNSCAAAPANRVCTPVLNVVDATSFTVKARIPIGNNAHGVDFDSALGIAFLPYSNSTLPAGCGNCAANGFTNGGVTIIKYR